MMHEFRRERGAVLAISMIILLVLTILSVSAARTTLLQEKMTFSVNDSHAAFEAAELALREAEDYLDILISTADFSDAGTNGLYTAGNGPDAPFEAAAWTVGKYRTALRTPDVGVPAARYYIEEVGELNDVEDAADPNLTGGYNESTGAGAVTGFRIVARGEGRSSSTERILVSYYGRRL